MKTGLMALAAASLTTSAAAHADHPAFVPDAPAQEAVGWTEPPRSDPDTIRFIVIGDRTGLARPGVFEQAVKQADGLRPEFVINVGDLIEGYTSDAAELAREWNEIDAAIAATRTPFFFVAGNHDLGNQLMLDSWRRQRGEPYYAFTWKGALFLVLDTEDPPIDMPPAFAAQFHQLAAAMKVDPKGAEEQLGAALADVNAKRASGASDPAMKAMESARFSDKQVQWAIDVLRRHADARWTFVLMHKPAWKLNSAQFTEIETALGDRGYTVIAGHNHYYAYEQRNGRDYITMGTAGAVSHQHGPGEMDHLAWVTLENDDAPSISLLKLTGILDREGESHQPLAK
ncbi:metallophosphoesterase [Croceicoccus estronivorus]|uniref:metallophosphoesterase family protein n=1 Tax=Croceicoccus estronivorus TaxID=1172626 RepID=UPI000833C73C|nr:metallophosphoesterase [Croceicoccus estronivorus]OCC23354.1 metallophosphoesterase [Croceicoccus estronivorus]